MGAATALLHGERDPSIAGTILYYHMGIGIGIGIGIRIVF
jgi:hypothetical protein